MTIFIFRWNIWSLSKCLDGHQDQTPEKPWRCVWNIHSQPLQKLSQTPLGLHLSGWKPLVYIFGTLKCQTTTFLIFYCFLKEIIPSLWLLMFHCAIQKSWLIDMQKQRMGWAKVSHLEWTIRMIKPFANQGWSILTSWAQFCCKM